MRNTLLATLMLCACDEGGSRQAIVLDASTSTVSADTTTTPEVDEPNTHGPQIQVAEGDEVIPQTTLHLQGTWLDMLAAGDPVVSWAWSVEQPQGSVSQLQPSASIANPTFEANIVGVYNFHLTMTTRSGQIGSLAFMVAVETDQGVHIELLWDTPGDINQSDVGFTIGGKSLGSDVDLHLMPADSVTTWFDDIDDCYWLNKNPQWMVDDEALPSLDRDDTDGAGPENTNVTLPPDGACYRVGVHFWDDWAYGYAFATVRVYLDGVLAYGAEAMLRHHDMWEVGVVCYDGTLTMNETCDAEGCAPTITPNFPIPF